MMTQRAREQGLTLIEVMVVVAILGVVLALAAPSFRSMIEMQRLRGVQAQMVTDLQFARTQGIARNNFMRVTYGFSDSQQISCYTIYMAPDDVTTCDCRLGEGAACAAPMVEVRTTTVPYSSGVRVRVVPNRFSYPITFDHVTGGLWVTPSNSTPGPEDYPHLAIYLDAQRALNTRINRVGRLEVCKPVGSTLDVGFCGAAP